MGLTGMNQHPKWLHPGWPQVTIPEALTPQPQEPGRDSPPPPITRDRVTIGDQGRPFGDTGHKDLTTTLGNTVYGGNLAPLSKRRETPCMLRRGPPPKTDAGRPSSLQIQGQFPAPHRRRGRGSPPPRGPRETPTPKRTATPCEDWRPRPPATRKNPSPELLELQGQGSATKQALPAASAQSRGVSVLLFLSHQNGCCRAAPRPLRFAPDAPRYWLALGAAQADWRV